jgi:hypothetical protein
VAEKRGGKRPLVWATVSALAAAAIVLAALWLNGARTYDDVGPGSFARGGGKKPFSPGGRIRLGFKIRNDGDRKVKVLKVGGDPGDPELFQTGVRMSLREEDGPPRQVVAFEPFELAGGHERYVELQLRMGGCVGFAPGTSVDVDSAAVRYRTLFFERTTDVPLFQPLVVSRGKRARCRR